jgi:nucleoside-diphosphate-sugar epimerase
MKPSNLIIGSSSQIANYLPKEDFFKVNSRNFSMSDIEGEWDTAILAFGENRKFLGEYLNYKIINIDLTFRVLEFLVPRCKKIIVFSTCELWNKCSGPVDIETPMDFYETYYTRSKFEMTNKIIEYNEVYPNVHIIYPFNFNSVYRTNDFLFGKIFNSIIENKKISIGDTYYYRDIFHPNFMVSEMMKAEGHQIVGSGRLTHVNDFIRNLYDFFGRDYEGLVTENLDSFKEYDIKYEYYLKSKKAFYTYDQLFSDTVYDLKLKLNGK